MSRIKGVKRLRRKVRAMPNILAERAADEIAETVKQVRDQGRENIQTMTTRRTGTLLRFYRSSVSRGSIITGKVGYITARARSGVFYARFIHDGTRYIAARPFHALAVEGEEHAHLDRMRLALRDTLRRG